MHAGVPFGGVLKAPWPDTPTHWLNDAEVADIDAALAESANLGGLTVMPPGEVPTVGRIAIIKDPQGAVIGLHQRSALRGTHPRRSRRTITRRGC